MISTDRSSTGRSSPAVLICCTGSCVRSTEPTRKHVPSHYSYCCRYQVSRDHADYTAHGSHATTWATTTAAVGHTDQEYMNISVPKDLVHQVGMICRWSVRVVEFRLRPKVAPPSTVAGGKNFSYSYIYLVYSSSFSVVFSPKSGKNYVMRR